jgi:hypothetical protein
MPSIWVSLSPARSPARPAGLFGETIESFGASSNSQTRFSPDGPLDHPQSLHRIETPNHPEGATATPGTPGAAGIAGVVTHTPDAGTGGCAGIAALGSAGVGT